MASRRLRTSKVSSLESKASPDWPTCRASMRSLKTSPDIRHPAKPRTIGHFSTFFIRANSPDQGNRGLSASVTHDDGVSCVRHSLRIALCSERHSVDMDGSRPDGREQSIGRGGNGSIIGSVCQQSRGISKHSIRIRKAPVAGSFDGDVEIILALFEGYV